MTALARLASEPNSLKEYTIGELAEKYKISVRTLRFYESRGLFSPRRVGGSRFYSAADESRLALVLTGKRLGFTLTEIRRLLDSRLGDGNLEGVDFSQSLSRPEIEMQIGHLERRRDTITHAIDDLRLAQQLLGEPNGSPRRASSDRG